MIVDGGQTVHAQARYQRPRPRRRKAERDPGRRPGGDPRCRSGDHMGRCGHRPCPDASHAASAASPPRHLPITFRSAAAARLRAVRASSASIPARCRRSCRASATVGRAGRRLQAGGGGAPLVAAPPVTAGWPRLLGRRRGAEHQADAARQSRDAAPGPIRGCLPPLPQPALDRGRAALRRERRNAARRGGAPGSVLPPPR